MSEDIFSKWNEIKISDSSFRPNMWNLLRFVSKIWYITVATEGMWKLREGIFSFINNERV